MLKTLPVLPGSVFFTALCFGPFLAAQTPDSIPTADIGYGRQDTRTITDAVTHLESGAFNKGQVYEWNQLWQGLVPGFIVARAGSNPNEPYETRIRGLHTIGSRTQPLYVVDGVPGVDLFAVDPADVVSVDVLRDAASTAIYGGRGSAGVVLIQTRQNAAPGIKATYSGQLAYETPAWRYEVLDENAFVGLGGPDFSPGVEVNTDWQELVLRKGLSQAHHLGLSGSTGKGGYLRISLNYRNQEGVLRGTGFKQYNGNLLLSQKILDEKVTLGGGISMASRASDAGFTEAYRYAVVANPSSPVRSNEAEYARFGAYVEKNLFDYFNPVALIEQNRNDALTVYTLGHLRADALILPGLAAGLMVAREQSRLETGEYYSKRSQFRGIARNGLGVSSQTASQQDILEATLTWKADLSRLNVQLLGGYGWRQADRDGYRIQAGNIISDVLGNNNFGTFTDVQEGSVEAGSFKRRTTLAGFFGRAQLQWAGKYFLSFGARRDGASQLGSNARWGTFPFFSAGIDAAKLLKWKTFDLLKLRAGKGTSGNVPDEALLSRQIFSPSAVFYYNGEYVPGYSFSQSANPDLGWERHSEFSWGLDFALLKNRLGGSIDLYRYTSSDLILPVSQPVPPNFAGRQYQNTGELSGRGAEITLRYDAVKRQDFTWEIGLVAARSRVTIEMTERSDTMFTGSPGAPCGCGAAYYLQFPGAALGTFWGPVTNGELDANGNLIYENLDKNPQLDIDSYNRDQTDLGSGQPKWEFGLRQKIVWRNFDLNVMLRGAAGHMIAHEMRLFYENLTPGISTWNHVVTSYFNDQNRSINRFSNRFLEKGAFLRLQNVALGYRFPLATGSWMQGLHVQIGAQNLLTLTNYTGHDPEIRLSDAGATDNGSRIGTSRNPLLPGIDRRNIYPLARLWWLGVTAEF